MISVLRAIQIYSTPTKPGRLPISKSHFFAWVEPRLEKVLLGPPARRHAAIAYTERSLDKLIEEGIGEATKAVQPRAENNHPQM
jgi:hypothetical protein